MRFFVSFAEYGNLIATCTGISLTVCHKAIARQIEVTLFSRYLLQTWYPLSLSKRNEDVGCMYQTCNCKYL